MQAGASHFLFEVGRFGDALRFDKVQGALCTGVRAFGSRGDAVWGTGVHGSLRPGGRSGLEFAIVWSLELMWDVPPMAGWAVTSGRLWGRRPPGGGAGGPPGRVRLWDPTCLAAGRRQLGSGLVS